MGDELRRRERERAAEQRHGHDRGHKRARGPHCAPEYLDTKVLDPGAVRVTPPTIGQSRRQDPLVQSRRCTGYGQAPKKLDQPGRPAELRRAGRATAQMVGQRTSCSLVKLIE